MPLTTFPAVRIETERMLLREFGPGDSADLANVIAACEWEALPPGSPREPIAMARWLREKAHRFRSDGLGVHLAIVDPAGGYLGCTSLFNPDWTRGRIETGSGLRSTARGRGYITEILRAVTHWALTEGGMRRIELKTALDNHASHRVAEKVGFVKEATILEPTTAEEMALYVREASPSGYIPERGTFIPPEEGPAPGGWGYLSVLASAKVASNSSMSSWPRAISEKSDGVWPPPEAAV